MLPSIRLADLAQQLDAQLRGDGRTAITSVVSMYPPYFEQITFLSNITYREQPTACSAEVP